MVEPPTSTFLSPTTFLAFFKHALNAVGDKRELFDPFLWDPVCDDKCWHAQRRRAAPGLGNIKISATCHNRTNQTPFPLQVLCLVISCSQSHSSDRCYTLKVDTDDTNFTASSVSTLTAIILVLLRAGHG